MQKVNLYQPILLRVLHGVIALLVFLALITGFWVYDTYDKRWGALSLPKLEDIQGLHGTIALTFLLILPVFALYSFHLGYRRLVQGQSFRHLKQIGQPVWWISLHRFANTLMLLAGTFAVISGRMMKEEWLPAGELNHQWYLLHLKAWVCLITSVALHLLMGAKVGGVPLLLSMFKWHTRAEDAPNTWLQGLKARQSSLVLGITEAIVLCGLVLAFILPAFSP